MALLEKNADPNAFKRICSHLIQPEGLPTLARLGLLEPILAAGAAPAPLRAWTPEGMIDPPDDQVRHGINLRRERLDPLVREAAAATPGVELMLGLSAERLLRDGGAVAGVAARDRDGAEHRLRAPLTVGADGRGSRVAELAGADARTRPHGRVVYAGYWESAYPDDDARARVWFMDPDCGLAFRTDSGLTICGVMPTADRLPEFRADPEAAIAGFFAGLPEAPRLDPDRRVGSMLGKIDMTNRIRRQSAPGLALVGDAALAADPLFGIGCGWALRSAEWMAASVAPALGGAEPLDRGLTRYRRLHRRRLGLRAATIFDYSTGRPMYRTERGFYRAAARDPAIAAAFGRLVGGQIGPGRMLAEALPHGALLTARDARRRFR